MEESESTKVVKCSRLNENVSESDVNKGVLEVLVKFNADLEPFGVMCDYFTPRSEVADREGYCRARSRKEKCIFCEWKYFPQNE